MLEKFQDFYLRKRFDLTARSVRSTPPIAYQRGKIRFVSLVCHKDLDRYLIAIKSVYSKIGHGDIAILDDGTLTNEDRDVLNQHLANPTFYSLEEIPTGSCPSYICWSRLLLIAELCKDSYIVQVDSDIVAQGDLTEAIEAIDNNESFILVNKIHPGKIKLADMATWLEDLGWNYSSLSLQITAEFAFRELPIANEQYYVRGSAAFVGFPKNCTSMEKIEAFSNMVEEQAGPLWREWGSEQTTTNYVIANTDAVRFLEYPAYVNHLPSINVSDASLVHFFGTHRYYKHRYLRSARRALKSLSN